MWRFCTTHAPRPPEVLREEGAGPGAVGTGTAMGASAMGCGQVGTLAVRQRRPRGERPGPDQPSGAGPLRGSLRRSTHLALGNRFQRPFVELKRRGALRGPTVMQPKQPRGGSPPLASGKALPMDHGNGGPNTGKACRGHILLAGPRGKHHGCGGRRPVVVQFASTMTGYAA